MHASHATTSLARPAASSSPPLYLNDPASILDIVL